MTSNNKLFWKLSPVIRDLCFDISISLLSQTKFDVTATTRELYDVLLLLQKSDQVVHPKEIVQKLTDTNNLVYKLFTDYQKGLMDVLLQRLNDVKHEKD